MHHAVSFFHAATCVYLVVTVLLQEIFADDASNLQIEAFCILQRVRSDELHNFLQSGFALQQCQNLETQFWVFWCDVGTVPRLEDFGEQAVALRPVDGWEVTRTGKARVERPERASDTER